MKTVDFKSKNFWRELEASCAGSAFDASASEVARSVIENIRKNGDKALFEYEKKFDGADISAKNIRVSKPEIAGARTSVSKEDLSAIREAIKCVSDFHRLSKPKNWRAKNFHGAVIGENFYPIKRVGIYIPGGSAPLVSTVVMTATIAKLAGCPQICVCTPPRPDGTVNPHILAALSLLGIDEIYKAGGAQAIAAMGVGTKSVPKVDKLFGPGNAYVVAAKKELFGEVGCDLLPGPSEVMIIADNSAKPNFVASDLLSQAEHGSGKEKIFLACLSKKFALQVEREISKKLGKLSRADKLSKVLKEGTFVAIVPDLRAAAEMANFVAPEHLELEVEKSEAARLASEISTAGAILSGGETPTVLGDFTAGPSHTLPTGRTGRFSGGLQIRDFMRRSSFVSYDKKSLKLAAKTVAAFSKMESLDAHGNSLLERLGPSL